MTKRNVNFRWMTVALEHWFFPLIFMFFAIIFLVRLFDGVRTGTSHDPLGLLHLIRLGLLCIFNGIVAYFLYMTRNKTSVYPDQWSQIVLPVLATFWFLTYSVVEWVPGTINQSFVPQPPSVWLVGSGIGLCILGQIVSLFATIELKQSFGIVVKVNAIITSGIYRLVRHPIYLGYCLMTFGFMLMAPRIIHWIVYLLAIVLQIWRARTEENMLAKVSEEYRSYCRQVPFLFPNVIKLFGESVDKDR